MKEWFPGGAIPSSPFDRGGTSLLNPLGSAASHGCVRLSNRTIESIVRRVGAQRLAGIPVRIS